MYVDHDLNKKGLCIKIYCRVQNMRTGTVVSLSIETGQFVPRSVPHTQSVLLKTRQVQRIYSPFAGRCRATVVFWRKTFYTCWWSDSWQGWRSRVSHQLSPKCRPVCCRDPALTWVCLTWLVEFKHCVLCIRGGTAQVGLMMLKRPSLIEFE